MATKLVFPGNSINYMSKKHNKKHRKLSLAERADRFELYERAVQCAEAEIDFVGDTFKKLCKRPALRLREDFCATANVACEWVRRHPENTAVGVDLDAEVLQWSEKNHLSKLSASQQSRIQLVQQDVMAYEDDVIFDLVLAMNFSYWVFLQRKTTIEYFSRVRSSLAEDGILFLDAYGGHEAYEELSEETEHKDFTYVWQQQYYNPINNHARCYIHFKFADGSKIHRAFEYYWRLWSLPEITEMLLAAGFAKATIYWEGTDEEGNGNGIYLPATEGEADAGWVAYIVAEKQTM